jgi:hypothetical protein
MISSSSSLASSTPATSLNVMRFCESVSRRALDLPKLMALPLPLCSWRMKRKKMTSSTIIGSHDSSTCGQMLPSLLGLTEYLTSAADSIDARLSGYSAYTTRFSAESVYVTM